MATPTGLITCHWNLEDASIFKQRSAHGTALRHTGLVCNGVHLQRAFHCHSGLLFEFDSNFGAEGTAEM